MGTLDRHRAQYRTFKASADLAGLGPEARVELLFVAAYHLIDACAAKEGVHINKHQMVRRELEKDPLIFGDCTREIVEAFRELQGTLRVRFVYGGKWTPADKEHAEEHFTAIERICLEVLGA